jgi:hypothetical protein
MPSASQVIANVVLPNLMKLKGAATMVSAIERRDDAMFKQVFTQTGIEHVPQLVAKERDVWRIGVITMPPPNEMGDAHLCAFVAKKNDGAITRYFTLEHDYVLATQSDRTVVCERIGTRQTKHGDGPPITGDAMADASAFIDAIMEVISPTRLTQR